MSVLTEQTRSIFPITWDALANDESIGEDVLTLRVKVATVLVMGEDVPSGDQGALNFLLTEFIAKKAALDLIGMAIDFWMTQAQTLTQSQTVEVIAYTDRINALEELKKSLMSSIRELGPLIEDLIPDTRAGTSAPRLSSIDTELLSPDPVDMGRKYAEKEN